MRNFWHYLARLQSHLLFMDLFAVSEGRSPLANPTIVANPDTSVPTFSQDPGTDFYYSSRHVDEPLHAFKSLLGNVLQPSTGHANRSLASAHDLWATTQQEYIDKSAILGCARKALIATLAPSLVGFKAGRTLLSTLEPNPERKRAILALSEMSRPRAWLMLGAGLVIGPLLLPFFLLLEAAKGSYILAVTSYHHARKTSGGQSQWYHIATVPAGFLFRLFYTFLLGETLKLLGSLLGSLGSFIAASAGKIYQRPRLRRIVGGLIIGLASLQILYLIAPPATPGFLYGLTLVRGMAALGVPVPLAAIATIALATFVIMGILFLKFQSRFSRQTPSPALKQANRSRLVRMVRYAAPLMLSLFVPYYLLSATPGLFASVLTQFSPILLLVVATTILVTLGCQYGANRLARYQAGKIERVMGAQPAPAPRAQPLRPGPSTDPAAAANAATLRAGEAAASSALPPDAVPRRAPRGGRWAARGGAAAAPGHAARLPSQGEGDDWAAPAAGPPSSLAEGAAYAPGLRQRGARISQESPGVRMAARGGAAAAPGHAARLPSRGEGDDWAAPAAGPPSSLAGGAAYAPGLRQRGAGFSQGSPGVGIAARGGAADRGRGAGAFRGAPRARMAAHDGDAAPPDWGGAAGGGGGARSGTGWRPIDGAGGLGRLGAFYGGLDGDGGALDPTRRTPPCA